MPAVATLRPWYVRASIVSTLALLLAAGCGGVPAGTSAPSADDETSYSTIEDDPETAPFDLHGKAVALQDWAFTIEPKADADAASPYRFHWNFGDGSSALDGGLAQEHKYAAEGEYEVAVEGAHEDGTTAFVLRARIRSRITSTDPLVSAGADQTVTSGDTVCLQALGDLNWASDDLSVIWTESSGVAVQLEADPDDVRKVCFTAPAVPSDATLHFFLTVSDGASLTSDDVIVVVQPRASTAAQLEADAGPDQTVEAGATVVLSGTATGDGADDAEFAWFQAAGTSAPLNGADAATATFVAPAVDSEETLVFRLRAAFGDSVAIDEVNVTVTPLASSDGLGGGGLEGEDLCPDDPDKLEPGACGCGIPDTDSDSNGTPDCLEQPTLDGDVDALDFGGSLTALAFNIWNAGPGSLSYTISEQAAWLSVSPASGSSAGEHDRINVTVNRTGLAPGAYEANIVVQPNVGAAITIVAGLTVAGAAAEPMSAASRTSGVAPLSVFFDALAPASGVVQPGNGDYPTQFYAWDFGDGSAGTWRTTGRSRNLAFGYVAGHVYETPGTYTAKLLVIDQNGASHDYTQTITVTDPASESGWVTYYVAANGDDTANDGKSTAKPFKTFAQAMTRAQAKTRILFRRGDTFAVTTGKSFAAGPGIVGAYGDSAAAAPVLDAPSAPFVLRVQSPDWRFVDLKLNGGSVTDSAGVDGGSAACVQLLALRVEIVGFYVGIINTYYPQPIVHDHNFIVDCDLHGQANKAVFIGGTRSAVLGSALHDTASHILRIWHAEKFVVSENNLLDPLDPVGAVIKLHNATEVPNLPDGRYIIISGNKIRGHTWAVTIGTQGAWANETVRDVVVERNYFLAGPSTRISCRISAQNVLARNNVGDVSGAPDSSHLLSVTRWGAEPPPTGARLYNNSVYRSDAGTAQLLEVPWTDTIGYNNLAYAPAGTAVLGASGGNFANNLIANPKWVNPGAGDFRLQAGSPCIDAGRAVPVADDFRSTRRPVDGNNDGQAQYDVGAVEYAP